MTSKGKVIPREKAVALKLMGKRAICCQCSRWTPKLGLLDGWCAENHRMTLGDETCEYFRLQQPPHVPGDDF